MNDYKITLNKRQQYFLSRLLPKGYSFELYKVRKNINDYPYKEFNKKYKKTDSIILGKRESLIIDSMEPSQKSFKQKSQVPSIIKEPLTTFQLDLIWLTRKLRKHESSYPFRNPVDPRALQIPDYFDVVMEPIDLKTIEEQIRADYYHQVSEFERDIYKMLMNSYKFNQKSTNTYNKTIQFEQFFSQTMKQLEKLKEEELSQPKDDKDIVKEEMIEQNVTMTMRNEEIQAKQKFMNLFNTINENHTVTVAVNNTMAQASYSAQKNEGKPMKSANEAVQERPRVSKKKLAKMEQLLKQVAKGQCRQAEQPVTVIKKEEPEFSMEEDFFPMQQQELPVVSQAPEIEEVELKKEEEQQINEEMQDYLDNQTVKENNLSEGCNEFTAGNKIRNVEVQKQITSLLKKLNEYPLTKQKKHKLLSRMTNLEQNMTQTDKKKLFEKIHKLDQNDIEFVITILTRGRRDLLKQDEFELDLDKADSKVLREIQNFMDIRDNAFPVLVQSQLAPPLTQSLEMLKVPKKIKKQEKKMVKKKLSRKNSNNDESFSINPPQIKKKKSQKPTKRHLKGEEQSELNGENNSVNNEKESSSSYRPEQSHQGRFSTSVQIPKTPETQKMIQGRMQEKEKGGNEEKNRRQRKQEEGRYDSSQIFINQTPAQFQSSAYHYKPSEIYDIDQFLVSSSKHFPNEVDEESEHEVFRSGRKKRQSVDPLDFMYDHNFQFGNSGMKDYEEEEIQEYSLEEQGELQNDEDQFL